jgi:hypothetical protein
MSSAACEEIPWRPMRILSDAELEEVLVSVAEDVADNLRRRSAGFPERRNGAEVGRPEARSGLPPTRRIGTCGRRSSGTHLLGHALCLA